MLSLRRITHLPQRHRILSRCVAIGLLVSTVVIIVTVIMFTRLETRMINRDMKEEARRQADRVTNLTGQPPVKFEHYAGYIALRPGKDEKALFYWFFEAQENASQKPLVMWLNGGSGCSSLAIGAIQEIGPFLLRRNGTQLQLVLNEQSWNKAANILFVEAPVGVGFSYTNRSEDLLEIGDRVTADDSHAFLLRWFDRFPSLRRNSFYIAGESYAGHYVPQLAELIYERNRGAGKNSYINLQGLMIGNPVMNDPTDSAGFVDFAWNHGIISDQMHAVMRGCYELSSMTTECFQHQDVFLDHYKKINMYNIYMMFNFKPGPKQELDSDLFLNRADIQKALHANVTGLPYNYSQCSTQIKEWKDTPKSVLPVINKLLKARLRVWIYSGDTDGRVPLTSTRYSINEMRLKVTEEWRAWYHLEDVGGWVETYDGGLVLATVRGAGHQVPAFAPERALLLFSYFLSAEPLPEKPSG